MSNAANAATTRTHVTDDCLEKPTAREALSVWFRIGSLSFGGPAGQIALMHQILVVERRWISEDRFLHALNYCMLLPGPEAQQLATYVGWLLHGMRGGLIAGWLFVLPGALVIFLMSIVYVLFADLPMLNAVFIGIKATVLIVVIQAVGRVGKKVLANGVMVTIAALAFVGIFLFDIAFPLIVLGAAAIGFIGAKFDPGRFVVMGEHSTPTDKAPDQQHAPRLSRTLGIAFIGALLWFAPIALAALWLGPEHMFVDAGLFFSKLAVVTFGGAYAVLAYMAQQAVDVYQWLSPGEMLDGLGLAESTPGPLIMVVQFVGFLGAYRQPGTLEPMAAAAIGSALTVWVTFVPCFIWILLGAPYAERLRGNPRLSAALCAITAAVVGVILNLSIWFGLHVLFKQLELREYSGLRLFVPELNSLDLVAAGLALVAAIAIFRFKLGVIRTLGLTAAGGALSAFFV